MTTLLGLKLLAAWGLTWGIGHSKLTLGLRTWLASKGREWEFLVEGLECPGCLGFHAGWLLAIWTPVVIPEWGWFTQACVMALASAAFCYAAAVLLGVVPREFPEVNEDENGGLAK